LAGSKGEGLELEQDAAIQQGRSEHGEDKIRDQIHAIVQMRHGPERGAEEIRNQVLAPVPTCH
jgi:hypothetical protein